MTILPGYSPREGETFPHQPVCHLHKSIYGLKQASRQWFHKFSRTLLQEGFYQSQCDYSLFVRQQGETFLALLVYVDDIVIASNDDQAVEELKGTLKQKLKMKDLGTFRYFLGLEIARNDTGITLCQRKYALDLLTETGYLGCKPSSIPMDPNIKMFKDDGELLSDITSYRRLIGKLLYLTISRPDICYSVNRLSQFLATPRTSHLQAALRILQYIKRTPGQGLFFPSSSAIQIKAFSDADWGTCPDTRRSLTGFCVFLGSSLVSWKLKKQQVVSRSSAEAEYRSMANTTCEIVWTLKLLRDLKVQHQGPALLYCDNQAALHIASNPMYHERTKHIELDCYFVREKIQDGTMKTMHISTRNQLADLMIKALHPAQFANLLSKMGTINLYLPS
ncbi:uncharacterized protein LOC110814369 [Carica papaya]|uniref:uncharacterized protein LOC110814369 n=1 Tax=Carica papaya TaxID=3649 RepID=UPI000B8CB90A|nr:uncharacterized protein LOC110814369 [Carica papaya]